MDSNNHEYEDPREIYKQPPYTEKEQSPPGSDEEMSLQADHGESSYKGTGRLKGRHALITGAEVVRRVRERLDVCLGADIPGRPKTPSTWTLFRCLSVCEFRKKTGSRSGRATVLGLRAPGERQAEPLTKPWFCAHSHFC
jgi:hypothetical protein